MKLLGLLLALTGLPGPVAAPLAPHVTHVPHVMGGAGVPSVASSASEDRLRVETWQEQEGKGKRGQGKKKGGKKKDEPKGREGTRVTKQLVLEAPDRVKIAVDLYRRNEAPGVPMIVLLHDAAGSRGEYRQIAPRLSRLGYNCMAVDLRAGGVSDTIRNMTVKSAERITKDVTIADAEVDVVTALKYVRETYPASKTIVLGCSYSGALALRLAGTRPELVDGVAAFSPSEYFDAFGKPATWIQDSVGSVACPVFVTSARSERSEWQAILAAIPASEKIGFVPKDRGLHGVAALSEAPDPEAYWGALTGFLTTHFPPAAQRDSRADHVLDRVAVLGASMTAGMWLETDLEAVLAATIARPGTEIRASSDRMFFTAPHRIAAEQLVFARELRPTLVVALDYLFWFGYGAKNAEARPLGSEEERLTLLEVGLAFLDQLDAPVIVGDFSDMSGAVGRMLASAQMPEPETLVALNARLAAWAEARGDVIVLPLADIVEHMRAGEPFEIGRYGWPAGSTDRLLHIDQLHPTLEGLAAIVHLAALELIEHELVAEEDLVTDLAAVLATFGAESEAARPILQTSR